VKEMYCPELVNIGLKNKAVLFQYPIMCDYNDTIWCYTLSVFVCLIVFNEGTNLT